MRSNMKQLAKRISCWADGLQGAAAGAVAASARRCAETAWNLAPVDSGELRNGIRAEITGGTGARVVSSANYSAMVEFGTCKMPPRPFMLPAAQAVRGEFLNAAENALREVMK